MKTFVLHDGEDEDKTEELHTFMGDMTWEGDCGGITIWLEARVGDTIVINDDDSVRIIRKGATTQ